MDEYCKFKSNHASNIQCRLASGNTSNMERVSKLMEVCYLLAQPHQNNVEQGKLGTKNLFIFPVYHHINQR
mgnify:CR=1 FL=1